MPLFRYEALDRRGKPVFGALDAADEPAVRAQLSSMGYQMRSATPAGTGRAARGRSGQLERAAARPQDLAIFFRQFAALARGGISPFQALESLAPRTTPPGLARAAAAMRDSARAGGAASAPMERFPGLFPAHVTGAVRAGETGGFLDVALDEVALGYEQDAAFEKGLRWPRILVVQAILGIALAQPAFPTLVPDLRVGAFFSLALLRNMPIALGLLALPRMARRWALGAGRAARIDALLLRLPVLGEMSRRRALAAFVRMLRRLYAAGIAPTTAWRGAADATPNAVIRGRLAEAHTLLQRGAPLQDAFSSVRLFPVQAEQLMATGVLSGEVLPMLDRIATLCQDDYDHAFSRARGSVLHVLLAGSIALTGGLMIYLTRTYFDSVFNFTKGWAD